LFIHPRRAAQEAGQPVMALYGYYPNPRKNGNITDFCEILNSPCADASLRLRLSTRAATIQLLSKCCREIELALDGAAAAGPSTSSRATQVRLDSRYKHAGMTD
jgi:hypothetical protein